MRKKPSILTNKCEQKVKREYLQFNKEKEHYFINPSEICNSGEEMSARDIRASWDNLLVDNGKKKRLIKKN